MNQLRSGVEPNPTTTSGDIFHNSERFARVSYVQDATEAPGTEDESSALSQSVEDRALAYREKIKARKCLNMLVDIRTGLVRQNKLLEILLEELKDPQTSEVVWPDF